MLADMSHPSPHADRCCHGRARPKAGVGGAPPLPANVPSPQSTYGSGRRSGPVAPPPAAAGKADAYGLQYPRQLARQWRPEPAGSREGPREEAAGQGPVKARGTAALASEATPQNQQIPAASPARPLAKPGPPPRRGRLDPLSPEGRKGAQPLSPNGRGDLPLFPRRGKRVWGSPFSLSLLLLMLLLWML